MKVLVHDETNELFLGWKPTEKAGQYKPSFGAPAPGQPIEATVFNSQPEAEEALRDLTKAGYAVTIADLVLRQPK